MDEDYDEYDEYNDAADDWEAEAAEEEAREKELIEQKAIMEEKKQQKRIKAPVRAKKEGDEYEEEEEETLAADITRALLDMREKASSAFEGQSLLREKDKDGTKKGASGLIADMPVNTEEEAEKLGEAIAIRVLDFAKSQHFNKMIQVIFHDLVQEFKSRAVITAEASKVHVAIQEAKRRQKKSKKTKGGRNNEDTTDANNENEDDAVDTQNRDKLGFDVVNDKGGAADAFEDNDDFI